MLPLAVGEIATRYVEAKVGLNQKQSDTKTCETHRLDAVDYCTAEQTETAYKYAYPDIEIKFPLVLTTSPATTSSRHHHLTTSHSKINQSIPPSALAPMCV
jgi:hypothetical protein